MTGRCKLKAWPRLRWVVDYHRAAAGLHRGAVSWRRGRPSRRTCSPTPTVMTVSDKGGPPVMHAPVRSIPPQALHARVEGKVDVKVSIAGDGTVKQAEAISGPKALRKAAVDNVRQWQFEAKAQETQVDAGFSLRGVTRSLALPEPVRRTRRSTVERVHGSVRVVAMVDPGGPRRVRAAGDGTGNAGARRGGIGPAVDLPADAAQRQAGTRHRRDRHTFRAVGRSVTMLVL